MLNMIAIHHLRCIVIETSILVAFPIPFCFDILLVEGCVLDGHRCKNEKIRILNPNEEVKSLREKMAEESKNM